MRFGFCLTTQITVAKETRVFGAKLQKKNVIVLSGIEKKSVVM